ncbi:hypothetical protein K8D10_22695, partial [Aeromonas veronii]|uniref:hypothetical protein n=1 Tax=Aeromonas veronii TaxID=654 RepID=UPI00207D5337
STFKWYRNGSEIVGANTKSYTLVAEDEGTAIKFEVTPEAATGTPTTGTAVQSTETSLVRPLAGQAPVAANVAIDNPTPTVGDTLAGTYDYSDADGDLEGASTFKWYRNGSEIVGANTQSYTLVVADQGKAIKFEVTPVSATGAPNAGTAVQSAGTSAVLPRSCFTVDGLSYTCPLSKAEADVIGISYAATHSEGGVEWVIRDIGGALSYCSSLGGGYRLPTSLEVSRLFGAQGNMGNYGWPIKLNYVTSTTQSGWSVIINLESGGSGLSSSLGRYLWTCVR